MEPVPEGTGPQGPAGATKTQTLAPFAQRNPVYRDHPSVKYREIDEPNAFSKTWQPPKPTLPRRQTAKTWNATAKERNPLASSLTGPGRAGKYGELVGESGGRYQGEVLAGRPHGHGYYNVQKSPGVYELQYEGEWVQGRKEGLGTRYYHNNESYSGQFVADIRHGFGRYFFSNGDVYAGEWLDNRRTGRGTFFYANGDIFVGDFVRDKQEGMGVLFMLGRQRKYVAEYVNGAPTCGTMLEIDNADLEPLQGQLVTLALHKRLENMSNGVEIPRLPEIDIAQPNKILAEQFVAVRKMRAQSKNPEIREMQTASGSLADKELDMLRHSFSLMAGGDNTKAFLQPHQLRELCVMAGLDPAAPATHSLVDSMLARKDPETGLISFDACMQVALHYQVKVEPMLDTTGASLGEMEEQQEGVEVTPEQLMAQEQEELAARYGGAYETSTYEEGSPEYAQQQQELALASIQEQGEEHVREEEGHEEGEDGGEGQ